MRPVETLQTLTYFGAMTMPFKSDKQRAWMYKNKPKLAKKFEDETPKGKKLPKRVKKTKNQEPIIK